jgi:SAM-dependent methyltransferase
MDRKELLLGSGSSRERRICPEKRPNWSNLVTLDLYQRHNPDVVHDLKVLPYPFSDNEFDEIHAYEVLEHCGRQGDYIFFFAQFQELWRILKPGGYLVGTVPLPTSPWAWGDPSHTRILPKECFTFLDQTAYTEQIGKTSMSDFRDIYTADFNVVGLDERQHNLAFALQAIKPSRIAR